MKHAFAALSALFASVLFFLLLCPAQSGALASADAGERRLSCGDGVFGSAPVGIALQEAKHGTFLGLVPRAKYVTARLRVELLLA